MTTPSRPDPLPMILVVLTVTTGLMDTVSVLGLGRVFTASMTGNVVFLGFAAAGVPGFSVARALTSLAGSLNLWTAGLPQHHLRRVMQCAHDEEPPRRYTRGGSRTTRETLERSDRLHDACAIGIRLQDCQRFELSVWRVVYL